jgi:hypothetical protein
MGKTIISTRISKKYFLFFFLFLFIASQIRGIANGDYFSNKSWLSLGLILFFLFIFHLFLIWKFELTETEFRVKMSPLLFFRKIIVYKLDEIEDIKIINWRGKGTVPHIKIKIKGTEKLRIHYYSYISTKSLKEMVTYLTQKNIPSSLID